MAIKKSAKPTKTSAKTPIKAPPKAPVKAGGEDKKPVNPNAKQERPKGPPAPQGTPLKASKDLDNTGDAKFNPNIEIRPATAEEKKSHKEGKPVHDTSNPNAPINVNQREKNKVEPPKAATPAKADAPKAPEVIGSFAHYLSIVDTATDWKDSRLAVYCYLLNKGFLKDHHCIGLTTNIFAESAMDPTIKGDGGKALGLCQWHPNRQVHLFALAKATNRKPLIRSTQLDFALHEMGLTPDTKRFGSGYATEFGAGKHLLKARSVDESTIAILKYYERSRHQDRDRERRLPMAEKLRIRAKQITGIPDRLKPLLTSATVDKPMAAKKAAPSKP